MIDPDALRAHIRTHAISCQFLTTYELELMFDWLHLKPGDLCVVVGSTPAIHAYWQVWRKHYRDIPLISDIPTLFIEDARNDLFFLSGDLSNERDQGRISGFALMDS